MHLFLFPFSSPSVLNYRYTFVPPAEQIEWSLACWKVFKFRTMGWAVGQPFRPYEQAAACTKSHCNAIFQLLADSRSIRLLPLLLSDAFPSCLTLLQTFRSALTNPRSILFHFKRIRSVLHRYLVSIARRYLSIISKTFLSFFFFGNVR